SERSNMSAFAPFRLLLPLHSCLFILLFFCNGLYAQQGDVAPTNSARDNRAEAATQATGIKVTFVESSPGVVIIESGGEKIRVDTTRKTVENLEPALAAAKTDRPAPAEKPKPQADTKGESRFDFETGEEPYDYRLINLPTPKSVPKG